MRAGAARADPIAGVAYKAADLPVYLVTLLCLISLPSVATVAHAARGGTDAYLVAASHHLCGTKHAGVMHGLYCASTRAMVAGDSVSASANA